MMLQGPTLHTVLLSGFAFTFAMHRNWAGHVTSRALIARRLRRLGFFLLLGYALHFPMAKLAHLYGMSEERWRSFLVVEWSTSPNQFLLRAGVVLLVPGAVTFISRRISKPPYVIQALARESLTIYAVHLCIVYGSVWNLGLRQLVGPSLTVLPALVAVATMWVSMAALACAWRWCKQHEPGIAQCVRAGTGGLLVGRLL